MASYKSRGQLVNSLCVFEFLLIFWGIQRQRRVETVACIKKQEKNSFCPNLTLGASLKLAHRVLKSKVC